MWRRSDSRCGDVVENMYWGLPSRKLSSDSRCGDVVILDVETLLRTCIGVCRLGNCLVILDVET